jgi:hypothetical protein
VEIDDVFGGRESLANGGKVVMLARGHSGNFGMAKQPLDRPRQLRSGDDGMGFERF